MARKTSSLASQLADLGNVAPAEYDLDSDPEAFDAGRRDTNRENQDRSDDDSDEEEKARNHALHNLVDVGPSKMRKQANHMEGLDDDTLGRYQGVKASRQEMMESEEESYSEVDDDDDDDDSDDDGSDELRGDGEESASSFDDEDNSEDEDEDDDDRNGSVSESESDDKRQKPKKTLRFAEEESANAFKAAQADAALLVELRQRRKDEAARGRDARRQTDAWGRLLGARIRAQKVVRGATRISVDVIEELNRQSETSEDRTAVDDTLAALDELSVHLFELQSRLLHTYAQTNEAAEGHANIKGVLSSMDDELTRASEPSSKRKRLNDAQHERQVSTLIALHDNVHTPLWRDILGKWSWRSGASTALLDDGKKAKSRFDAGGDGSGGLKAMNQSAEEQIKRGLQGDAYERLRKRTRVWRGSENEKRLVLNDGADGASDDEEQELGSSERREDEDVFDDSDFYATLLRELIDSKGGSSGGGVGGGTMSTSDIDGASAAWAQAAKRAAKKHRASVDRRASKGRRLRYDVHEKVQNFMPPIVRESWSDEQIERLMQQLRRTNGMLDETTNASLQQQQQQQHQHAVPAQVEMGGLKLFG